MLARFKTPPAQGGAVFGFGLGGLADGVVLHQILQWHHLVADDTTTKTVEGLEHNTLADGLFHAGTIVVLLAGAVLLWNAAKQPGPSWNRLALGGVLAGFGAFHIVDEIVFHVLLDLHHIRMVDNYLAYDLGFAAIGVALILIGLRVLRPVAVRT
jgi:uncharacterized membrane protein